MYTVFQRISSAQGGTVLLEDKELAQHVLLHTTAPMVV